MELHDSNPDRLLGDKGYDSGDIRDDLAERGIEPVIPPRSNRKTPIEYDREAYKRRNLIERCVNRLIPPHRNPLSRPRQVLNSRRREPKRRVERVEPGRCEGIAAQRPPIVTLPSA